MVGPQQTTGLIGQKWKTGNGLELTGTNRPTQTTTPHTHPPHNRGGVGETAAKCEASTIRSTPNPPPQPPPTHTRVGGGKGRWATTQPHSATDGTALPTAVSVVTATGKRPAPSRTRKLSLTAPMVLHPPGCGRVGHHRAHTTVGPMRSPRSHGPYRLLLLQHTGACELGHRTI